jgi:nitrous oxidase accessory protein NosD
MSFTLRGRLETRVLAALLPVLAACALAVVLDTWWPLELALLMVGVGIGLDLTVYHRALAYQPGWLALPLGLLELGIVMAAAIGLELGAPLAAALGLFVGSWVLGQLLSHAAFPLLRLSYGEDGGELGRVGLFGIGALAAVAASAGGLGWASQPPTMRLEAGMHQGPLVLDYEQTLAGEPGAVVLGGILVTADGVTVRDVVVRGGEHGIEVDGAERVRLERVWVSGATVDGINVRRAQVTIENCIVQTPASAEYVQGIDISFAADLPPSVVEGCIVTGGREGIVIHSAHVLIRDNRVTGTSLRGITVTEMSMGAVEENDVSDALGVGIFCGDYSECEIEDNVVRGTRVDTPSGNRTRFGYGVVVHYGAKATLAENELGSNPRGVGVFLDASIEAGESD